MATYERLDYGSADGCLIGGSATDKVGIHGKTPTVQAANVTAVLTTGAATALVGFASTAQLNAATDAINAILTCLKNKGLMATS